MALMWSEPLNRRENPVTRRSALTSAISELRNPVSGLRERVRGHNIAVAVANQSNLEGLETSICSFHGRDVAKFMRRIREARHS